MGDRILDLIGVYDNLDEPKPTWNEPSTAYGLIIAPLILTWFCVLFRLYTRLRVLYSPGWDDVFVSLLLVTGTLGSVCILIMTNHGLGDHLLLTSPTDFEQYLRFFWIANATYCMSTAFIKLSLLFQYFRIFEDDQSERRICYGLIMITALWGCAFSILAWLPCVPIRSFIELQDSGTCFAFGSRSATQFYATHLSMACSNMVLDIIVIYFPVLCYWRGKTVFTSRTGFIALFLVGSLVVAISIWRAASMNEHRAGTYPTFDPGWYGPVTIILATLEVNIASICASVPVFWPILAGKAHLITVTREVRIERTHRFSTITESADCVEMTSPSRATSERSLRTRSIYDAKKDHYTDDFILSQVRPVGEILRVETEVTAQKGFQR